MVPFKYSALNAKIRGMYGKLLSRDQLCELSQVHSVGEAVAYLRQTRDYFDILHDTTDSEIHRDMLERLLKRSLFEDYHKILFYLDKNDKSFLNALTRKYEITILKSMIRACFAGKSLDFFHLSVPPRMKEMLEFDLDKLSQATDVEDLIAGLKGTPFYRMLQMLYSRGKDPNLFDMEITLDIYYFTMLWNTIEKQLSGRSKRDIQKCIGAEADLLNLFWIYRCKKYYKMESELIFAILIPVHFKLKQGAITEIIKSDDVDLSQFPILDPYHELFEKSDEGTLKRMIDTYLMRLYNHIAASGKNLTMVLAYYQAKELETDQVSTIIEGVRYGLPPDEILGYAVF